jgi:hypothetical protein
MKDHASAPGAESDYMTRRTAPRRYALLTVTLLLAACASDAGLVSVEPMPPPGAVTFVLADRSLVYGLTVTTCQGRVMWTISNERNVLPPTRITYGVTPDGFVSRTGPKLLTSACYEVIVSGPSKARFHIGADGRLIASPSSSRADSARTPSPESR